MWGQTTGKRWSWPVGERATERGESDNKQSKPGEANTEGAKNEEINGKGLPKLVTGSWNNEKQTG